MTIVGELQPAFPALIARETHLQVLKHTQKLDTTTPTLGSWAEAPEGSTFSGLRCEV